MNPLHRSFLGFSLGLIGTLSQLTGTTVAAPPAAPAAATEKLIEFKKPEVTAQKAPDFTLKGGTTDKRFKAKDWLEVEFEIEAKAPKAAPKDTKFLDSIQVKFYVYLQPADVTKAKVLTADVTYFNVHIGDNSHCVLYLSPSTLLNLTGDKLVDKGMIKFLGAEATYNGAVVGMFTSTGTTAQPWWKAPKAPPAEAGRLLPKNKTPFAPLWYDYYLEEKADK
jgi:hypothetical protein